MFGLVEKLQLYKTHSKKNQLIKNHYNDNYSAFPYTRLLQLYKTHSKKNQLIKITTTITTSAFPYTRIARSLFAL